MREQRPVRHTGIAEKPVNGVKGFCQPVGIEARGEIAAGKACAKSLIGIAFRGSFALCAGGKDAYVPLIHQREDQAADTAGTGKQNRQRCSDGARQSTRQPSNRRANHACDQRANGLYNHTIGRWLGHPSPPSRVGNLYSVLLLVAHVIESDVIF
jgi:hypothetical protein